MLRANLRREEDGEGLVTVGSAHNMLEAKQRIWELAKKNPDSRYTWEGKGFIPSDLTRTSRPNLERLFGELAESLSADKDEIREASKGILGAK